MTDIIDLMEEYSSDPRREQLDALRKLNGKGSCISNYGDLAASNNQVQSGRSLLKIKQSNDDFGDLDDIGEEE